MTKKRNTAELILNIAQKKFARYGLQKTTIDEIARDAHISKGLIYHYYRSKEDMYIAVIEREASSCEASLVEKLSRYRSPRRKLETFVEIKREILEQNFNLADMTEVTLHMVSDKQRARLLTLMEWELGLIVNILHEGMRAGYFRKMDCRTTAQILLVATDPVQWTRRGMHFGNGTLLNPATMIKSSLNVLLDGLMSPKIKSKSV
jgi:AcrR family transcriptional regulator